jgi:serine protease Do
MSEDKNRKKSIFRKVKRDNVSDTPATPSAPAKDFGYSAFTSPVEKDYSPYSPQTLSSASQENESKEDRTKVKRVGIAKFFAIGLVALALIVISSFATYLFSHYDFQLSSGNGVIKFTLIPRTSKTPQDQGQQQNLSAPSESKDPSAEQSTPQPVQKYNSSNWDGSLMKVGSSSASHTLTLQQIYTKCAPSVVAIHSETQDSAQNGAGIIISASGYIVTNQHITYGASSISVTLDNGSIYAAALVGEDEQTDIAVIKIEASGLVSADFADYQSLSVGDSAVTIGNLLNQSLSMTDGIITAINRNVSYNGFSTTLIQTNAYINSGNSGGPLINMSGQVVGITNAALSPISSAFKGIGFAIPAITAKPIVDEILKEGYVKGRPSLGVRLSDIAISAYAYYKLPTGVYVSRVYSNSDAYAKGVQPGDVICAVNNKDVSSLSELTGIVNAYAVGETLKVKLYRNGSYITFEITLMDKAELK